MPNYIKISNEFRRNKGDIRITGSGFVIKRGFNDDKKKEVKKLEEMKENKKEMKIIMEI